MYDAKYTNEYNSKWIKYGQRFKTLILNDGITHIGARAFAGCDFTGELEIPESVTSIGFGAFSCCDFTGKLKIPQNVTYIGYRAFEYCTGFTGELEIPEGVKGIWSSTFEGCTGFTGKLKIPESVTEIESSAFYRCTGFTGELEIPEGVTSIGQYAFSGCTGFAGKVKIPESVTYIGVSAFKACSGIESVEFVGNASIDPASFESCTNLHTITVFSNAYILGDKFTNCPLLNEIKGYIGSEAEKYAKKKEIQFIALETINIENATVEKVENQQYTGKEVRPDVIVKYNGKTLNQSYPDYDYKIEYEDNITPGWATAIIKGNIKYSGTQKITFKIIESEHNYGEWVITKLPSLTEEGEKKRVCKVCNESELEAIPKTEPIQSIPPKYGQTIVDNCVYIDSDMTLTDFTFTQNVVVKKGCTLALYGNSSCEKSLYVFGTVINRGTLNIKDSLWCLKLNNMLSAGNYNYGYFYSYGRCEVDTINALDDYLNYYYVQTGEEIPVCEHEWTDWEIKKNATCTINGEKKKVCLLCGEPVIEEILATGHNEIILPSMEATCEEDGMTEGKKCSVCGVILERQSIIPALGHSWDDGKVSKEATCIEEGEKTYTCNRCNKNKTENISKIPHSIVIDPEEPATCTKAGKTEGSHCSVCGEIVIPQKIIQTTGEHSWNSGSLVKAALCTQNGEIQYTCTKCGLKRTETVKALGHKKVTDKSIEATCEKEGKTEGSHCSICGEVLVSQKTIPATGHSWSNWITVKNASVSSEGAQQRTCSKCGKLENKNIPKLTPTPTVAPTIPSAMTIAKGKSTTLKPAASWKNVKYSTSNKKVATVDKKGKVKAVGVGTAKITVKSGSKKAVCTITVPGTTAIKGIKTSISIKKGKSYTLKPKLNYVGKADTVTYKTSNKKVATVTSSGKITGKKKGTATITIKSGKVTKKCKVKVK